MFELNYTILFTCLGLCIFLIFICLAILGKELLYRPYWRSRSTSSKVLLGALMFALVALSIVPTRMLWLTRAKELMGTYTCSGVWGTASLNVKSDGTFGEQWQFKNQYTEKPEGSGSTIGTWHDQGRDWFTRDVLFQRFVPLGSHNEEDLLARPLLAEVRGYGGVTSMELDPGSDLVCFK